MVSALDEYIEITSMEKLFEIIANLRDMISDKKIIINSINVDLAKIKKDESLPEVIEVELTEVSTKYEFKLYCETYQGSGGYFKKVS